MIKSWSLSNFKSVYDATELSFLPLTVFAGANSSGKSTFIQSMLLVAQTIDNQVNSKPIVLNGHMARLGTFDDLASSNSGKSEISIGFSIMASDHEQPIRSGEFIRSKRVFRRSDAPLLKVDCEISFSSDSKAFPKDLLQLQPLLTYSKISAQVVGKSEPSIVELKRHLRSAEDRLGELDLQTQNVSPNELQSLEFEVLEPKQLRTRRFGPRLPASGRAVGAKLNHFLPYALSAAYDSVGEYARQIVKNFTADDPQNFEEEDLPYIGTPLLERLQAILVGAEAPQDFSDLDIRKKRFESSLVELRSHLDAPNLLKAIAYFGRRRFRSLVQPHEEELIQLSRGNLSSRRTVSSFPVDEEIAEATHYVRTLFAESFKYLGPLRDEPKAVYPMEAVSDPGDVGLKGQYTAAVLDLFKTTHIQYIPSAHFTTPHSEPEIKRATLKDAVQDWLNYLTVVSKLQTKDRGIFGHELQVSTSSSDDLHNLSHVGVGVSQVLPILVMSLLADSGSVLVFEQPEIHLNPKVQTLLGDFLLSMALLHKQCIVETHSEYLINRLRYRAVVDAGDKMARMMKLYFVENQEGHSTYRPVTINEYGSINDWPTGFFDESPQEAEKILRAAVKKRTSTRDKNAQSST